MALIKDIYQREVLTSALELCRQHALLEKQNRNVVDFLFLDIDSAFSWKSTSQGHEFWRNLNNELDSTNEYKNR